MTTRRTSLTALVAGICLTAFALAGCGGGGHNSAASVAKFCKDDAAANDQYDLSNLDPTDSSSLAQLDQALPTIKKVAAEAPAVLTVDMHTAVDALNKIANGHVDAINADALNAAAGRIQAFENTTCHLDTSSSDASQTSGTSATSYSPDTSNSSDTSYSPDTSNSSDTSYSPDTSYSSDSSNATDAVQPSDTATDTSLSANG